MSIFYNPIVFSLTIFGLVFTVIYLNFKKIFDFFTARTLGVQQEILEIMDQLLISQDKDKTVKKLWLVCLCLSTLGFIVVWPNVLMSVIAFAGLAIGFWWLVRELLKSLWEKHCSSVVNDLVEALTIMCNSIKVGLSLGQAIDRVIKGYPGALSKEFRLVLNKMELGQNLEESLEEMAKRVKKTEIDMLVSTVNILKETGGNLAETFFVMAETIRERQKMEKKIKALTAQGMMQAKIMACLPFGLVGLFFVMDRNHVMPLFTQPLGWLALLAMTVLVIVGWFLMKKMVEIKV